MGFSQIYPPPHQATNKESKKMGIKELGQKSYGCQSGRHLKGDKFNNKPIKREEAADISFAKKKPMKELARDECMWPIGDPQDKDFGFCGAKKEGGSYCEGHSKIAYTQTRYRGKNND